jgi:hypothetical protein
MQKTLVAVEPSVRNSRNMTGPFELRIRKVHSTMTRSHMRCGNG